MVVDSNYLRAPELRDFLTASPRNSVVLTDYVGMEAYKSWSLETLYDSMAIVGEHPSQVIVLRGTSWACGMRGRLAGLQRRLIDQEQTRDFANYCGMLRSAKSGNAPVRSRLLERSTLARSHMDTMLRDAETMLGALGDVEAEYTRAELAIIRGNQAFTAEIMTKLQKQISRTAEQMFSNHPNVSTLPNSNEFPHTFIFRTAFCAVLWALLWIASGSQQTVRPEKIRNDVVDMNFAVFATYFDGLLTRDRKLADMHRGLSHLLYRAFPDARPSR